MLDGKVAVITGGTSGIGLRTAELLIMEGARVTIAGRKEVEGRCIAARLGDAAIYVRADVRSEADVEALIGQAVRRFGRLDILVNNAGTLVPGEDISHINIGRLDEAFQLHVCGVVAGMKHAARVMIKQGSGSIINMGSIAGIRAGVAGLAYSATKAAVLHLTRCAAVELGEHGIRVNSVSPGPIVTGIFGKAMGLTADEADARSDMTRKAFEQVLPQVQPLQRIGTVEDVASAVLYLASDDSVFVTGHDLVIDGGSVAGRPAALMRQQWAALTTSLR